jgi:alanyl-tRNA synthetase
MAAAYLSTGSDQVAEQIKSTLENNKKAEKSRDKLAQKLAMLELAQVLETLQTVSGVNLLTHIMEDTDLEIMRQTADRFRQQVPEKGIVVLGAVINGSPRLVAAVTEDLIKQGLKAGDLVKFVANQVGGGGGGRPGLAEAGGKDPEQLKPALESVSGWIKDKMPN